MCLEERGGFLHGEEEEFLRGKEEEGRGNLGSKRPGTNRALRNAGVVGRG